MALAWMKFSVYLETELMQSADEGIDVSRFSPAVKEILDMPEGDHKETRARALLDEIALLRPLPGFKYVEPSGFAEIRDARPNYGKGVDIGVSDIGADKLKDKMYGAWLGRCAGCLLGKPVELYDLDRLAGLLKDTGNYPPNFYVSSDISPELKEKYHIGGGAFINNVACAPADDDTNYTVMALKMMEMNGAEFTPKDMAIRWLLDMPYGLVCTGERAAYRNFINLKFPPDSATLYNPYREWIGAQIRADFYGYVTPGNPELGAEFAWRDASMTSIKNGIYGEMFVAAMLSKAAVCDDMNEIVKAGLGQIPAQSRLYEKISARLEAFNSGESFEEARERLYSDYPSKHHHITVHTIPNAEIVANALLHGGGDFERTIGLALIQAMDTDCNCATAGSVIGMVLGAAALPGKWISPLNDTLQSGVNGFGSVKISELASRTYDVYSNKVKPTL